VAAKKITPSECGKQESNPVTYSGPSEQSNTC
jgi:hypothetical protein